MTDSIAAPAPEVVAVYFLIGDGPNGIKLGLNNRHVQEAFYYPGSDLLALMVKKGRKSPVYFNHGNHGSALAEAEAAAKATRRGKFRLVMSKEIPVSECEEVFRVAREYEKARLKWLRADRKYQREGTSHSLNDATRAWRKYADLHPDFVASARCFIDESFGEHICWE